MQTIDDLTGTLRHIGDMLRDWRQRRHLSQRALANAAGVSPRAVSELEAGRRLPNLGAILRLTERLEIPLRDRNAMLVAAGHEAAFSARPPGDPALAGLWAMVEQAVRSPAPFPALALDRRWRIVASNDALRGLIAGVDPALLSAPINWARVVLHPAGLAPRIANLNDWREHVLNRLRRHFDLTGAAFVADLLEEIGDYPVPAPTHPGPTPDGIAVPLRLMTVDGLLSFYSATSAFGSAIDVTLSELTIEAFYPADEETAAIMRRQTAPPATAD
jgi:transcriptional regulator with XRE-family HTH domain